MQNRLNLRIGDKINDWLCEFLSEFDDTYYDVEDTVGFDKPPTIRREKWVK